MANAEQIVTNGNGNGVESDEEERENDVLTKDPVSKFQFEYNRNTCFSNDIPELAVNENVNHKRNINFIGKRVIAIIGSNFGNRLHYVSSKEQFKK